MRGYRRQVIEVVNVRTQRRRQRERKTGIEEEDVEAQKTEDSQMEDRLRERTSAQRRQDSPKEDRHCENVDAQKTEDRQKKTEDSK